MPRIEAFDGETTPAQLMHQTWRHRAGLDADAGIPGAMPPDGMVDLSGSEVHWPRQSLRPESSTTQIAVTF